MRTGEELQKSNRIGGKVRHRPAQIFYLSKAQEVRNFSTSHSERRLQCDHLQSRRSRLQRHEISLAAHHGHRHRHGIIAGGDSAARLPILLCNWHIRIISHEFWRLSFVQFPLQGRCVLSRREPSARKRLWLREPSDQDYHRSTNRHGRKDCCMRPLFSVGNISSAMCDLWTNESVQNVRLLGGQAPEVCAEMLIYDCRLMNTAHDLHESKVLRRLFVESDRYRDPQALFL